MNILDLFPKTPAETQAEQDRQAKERATAPTTDSRTGEQIQHCTGRRHKWNALRSPHALVCDRCGEIKLRDR